MKKITALLFIAALFINSPAYAENIDLDFSGVRPVNASVRSALMPGWGQGWNNQPVKGWITFGVFAVSVAGAFYFNAQAYEKYDSYEEKGIVNGKLYNEYEDNRTLSQVFTFAAIGTWLYSVIDAYFVCKKHLASETPVSAFKFYYNQENDGYYLAYGRKIDI
ncbi:MAG: DUF5683 domain-containing protein [Endomicrobia bacterium]|nr:DUF5683 domain-containing protein [Endomicrobiia bacterium]